jgi:hypothetical protein
MQPHIYSLTPRPSSLEELIQKAKTFVAAAKAPATLKGYRNDWCGFESWCCEQNLPSLPSTPETVALYITDRASTLASGTITRRLTSITKAHQAAGFTDSPATTRHFVVGETLKGIRRTIGTAQHGKDPLLSADIRRIVAARREDLLGLRDVALVLIGFTGGFRRSNWLASMYVTLSSQPTVSSSASANRRQTRKAREGKWVYPSEPVRILALSARYASGSMWQGSRKARFSVRLADTIMYRGAACTPIRSASSSSVQPAGRD